MPMGVQRSVTERDPVMRDYTASSVEKDILPVGVKKRMIINCMAKVPIVLHSVRRHQLASLPGQMIRVPQPDRNAINLQCPTSAPYRVAKISKARKASVYCKEEDLIIQCPKKPEMQENLRDDTRRSSQREQSSSIQNPGTKEILRKVDKRVEKMNGQ